MHIARLTTTFVLVLFLTSVALPAVANAATFRAGHDARVEESTPSTNFGASSQLRADHGTNAGAESFLRFDVTGVTGPVASAKLRLLTTDGSTDGPAVYAVDDDAWTEGAIVWTTRPATHVLPLADVGSVASAQWVEYDVTSYVTGDGSWSFGLRTGSTDGTPFRSDETSNPPELVITPGAPPSARTDTFRAGHDTRAEENDPTATFGTSTQLRADFGVVQSAESFLRFDVAGLDGAVSEARLRVFTNDASVDGPSLHAVLDDSWTETGVSWNARPSMESASLGDLGAVATGTWVEYDVTPYVTGNGAWSFGLRTGSTDALYVRSDEAGSNQPQLVVTSEVVEPLPTCPTFGSAIIRGNVSTSASTVDEASGLGVSSANAGVVWTHNDFFNSATDSARVNRGLEQLHAFDASDASFLGTYEVSANPNGDWEDMAVGTGPIPGAEYLYVGNIGRPAGTSRNVVEVLRVPEPSVSASQAPGAFALTGVVRLAAKYPGSESNDAETLLFDRQTGDLYIVTKHATSGISKVYRWPAAQQVGGSVADLELVTALTFTAPAGVTDPNNYRAITGGAMSSDGTLITLKTYAQTFTFRRSALQSVGAALDGTRCSTPNGPGEAIDFAPDGSGYFTLSEGANRPLNFFPAL